MGAIARPLRISAATGPALAIVLVALIAIEAPARAQAVEAAGDSVPAAPTIFELAREVPLAPVGEGAPAAATFRLAVVGNPEAAVIPQRLLAAIEPPPTDVVVLGPGPVADALAPADETTPGDPFERTNRGFFKTQSSIDRRFFQPVAKAYQTVVPKPVRSGLRNIIRNLTEPIVFINDLLQLRPGRALKTLGRFAINSTVGLGGAIDVAQKLDLPYRSNGFGNTLGRWGVGPGPYLYLPLIGPTTLRDLLAGQIDGLTLPLGVGFPFDRLDYQLSRTVVSTIDKRAEAEEDLQALLSGAADPYATLRSVYLQSREAAIADARGKPLELAPLDDPLVDPAEPASDADAPDGGTGDPAAEPMSDPVDDTADPAETPPTDPVTPEPAPLPMEPAAIY